MDQVAARVRTFPIIEIFGSTIQGEGALAGLPTHFIRVGGCDYLCSWCDSMYAVDPAQVRANADKLTTDEILNCLEALDGKPSWVTISGGNPALLDLTELVGGIQEEGYRVCIETQGSRWKDWLGDVDCLTVSPKPPSSGMVSMKHAAETMVFMNRAEAMLSPTAIRALKIVVFDQDDLDWAKKVFAAWPDWDAYLSVGTDQVIDPALAHLTAAHEASLIQISDSYRWLCEQAATDPELADVRVLPQLHVIAWGHSRAV